MPPRLRVVESSVRWSITGAIKTTTITTMNTPTNSEALPLTNCSASSLREKVETERWFLIADWCKKKGISPWNADNFNRAAMEWAKLNCFEPTKCERNKNES